MSRPDDDMTPPATEEEKRKAMASIEEAGRAFKAVIRKLDCLISDNKDPSTYANTARDKVDEAIMWARRAYLPYGTF